MNRSQKQNKGSITIEATIGLTAYIFVIISVLSVINVCRAQMIVSAAVDATAKEMSQYAYFYDIIGIPEITGNLSDLSSSGKEQTNELIGYTTDMMGALSSGKDNVQQGIQDLQGGVGQAGEDLENLANGGLANAESNFEVALQNIESTYSGLLATGDNIKSDAQSFKAALDSLTASAKNMDVAAYMRSMGAMATNKALSALLAAPMAKGLSAKHFAGFAGAEAEGLSTWDKADLALKSLGIEEGMDGLNFLMSEMFSDDYPKQIHLVCYYTVPLTSMIDLPGNARMVFCKEAVTNAWLSGFKEEDPAPASTPAPAPEPTPEPSADPDATPTPEPTPNADADLLAEKLEMNPTGRQVIDYFKNNETEITAEEFLKYYNMPDAFIKDERIKAGIKKIRAAIPAPTEDSTMVKFVSQNELDAIMGGTTISGPVASHGDLNGKASTYDEAYDMFNLGGHTNSTFDQENDQFMYRIEFNTKDTADLNVPTSDKAANGSDMELLGTGFAGTMGSSQLIPVYDADEVRIAEGSIIYQVNKETGESVPYAVFKDGKWG